MFQLDEVSLALKCLRACSAQGVSAEIERDGFVASALVDDTRPVFVGFLHNLTNFRAVADHEESILQSGSSKCRSLRTAIQTEDGSGAGRSRHS
jgi:hypothetical protein